MSATSNAISDIDNRLAEIGEMLAVGLVRLEALKSSKRAAAGGESSLDFVGLQSGHDSSETENHDR